MDYRPALAAIPDQKGWRFDNSADYGGLNTFAQGKLDLGKVRRHWGEILRLIATIYTKECATSKRDGTRSPRRSSTAARSASF